MTKIGWGNIWGSAANENPDTTRGLLILKQPGGIIVPWDWGAPSTKEQQMSILSAVKSNGRTGEEVFTLDEGRVTISFPARLSSASLEDLRQYLDIFYRKTCRLTDDPVDEVDPRFFDKREKVTAAAE